VLPVTPVRTSPSPVHYEPPVIVETHEAHMESGDFPVVGCLECEEHEIWLFNQGLYCMTHGASYMNEGLCLMCREDQP